MSLPVRTRRLLAAALLLPLSLAAQQAPTGVSAAFDARGGVTVSWTAIKGAASYRVLRSPDQKATGEDLTKPLDPRSTSFQDVNVTPDATWFYQVIAVYGDGTMSASDPVQLQPSRRSPPPVVAAPVPPPPPAPLRGGTGVIIGTAVTQAGPPPTGITIAGTPAQAVVQWQPAPGAASYRVTRQDPGGPPVAVALPNPGWTDKGLRPGIIYTYVVDAFYPDGRIGSAQVQFKTPWALNPSAISASSAGAGMVKLSWNAVPGADYYIVLGPGSTFGGFKVVGLTTTTVTAAPTGSQTWMVGSYYDPGPNAPGVPVGPNAVSTPATQFTRITFVVPAPPAAPVAAVNTARMTSFNPAIQGFGFINDFKNSFIGPPINMTTGGLCGGMSYAVLDYYFAQRQVPNQKFRPANNTLIQQYLYARQVTSLLENLDKWAELSVNPMGARDTEFFNWGISSRLVELRSFIDRGAPVPVALKGGGGPNDSRDHQVLAIGYDMGRYAGDLGQYKTDVKIFLLDPNYPGVVQTLVPDPAHNEYYELAHPGEKWQTWFVDGKYKPLMPPMIPNIVYPMDNLMHELLLEFISGVDDMRGGADHVDVTVKLMNGTSQYYPNVSLNGTWLTNYKETAQIVLTPALPYAMIKSIDVSTNATGGLNGDNWDLDALRVSMVAGGNVTRLVKGPVGPFRFTGARLPFVVPIH